MAKLVCFFKPDTIIIYHQLELSGTRVKYLNHEKGHTNMRFGLTAYPKKSLIIVHSGVSRATSCLNVVLQVAYFVNARNESPGEVMRTCTHVGAFATSPCNKNHHFVC